MSKEINNMEKLMEDKNVQFRDFSITNIETRQDGDTEGMTVKGVPVVFDSETTLFETKETIFKEVIDRHAFDATQMDDVIFNYNHGGRVYARTRNDSLRLSVEEDGVHMEADLWADDEGHAELFRDIKRGNIDRMSFAFTVSTDEYEEAKSDDNRNLITRKITGIDRLFDVSAVDIPAYDATTISARRAFDAESERREAESRKAESLARAKEERHRRAEKLKAMNLKLEDEYGI